MEKRDNPPPAHNAHLMPSQVGPLMRSSLSPHKQAQRTLCSTRASTLFPCPSPGSAACRAQPCPGCVDCSHRLVPLRTTMPQQVASHPRRPPANAAAEQCCCTDDAAGCLHEVNGTSLPGGQDWPPALHHMLKRCTSKLQVWSSVLSPCSGYLAAWTTSIAAGSDGCSSCLPWAGAAQLLQPAPWDGATTRPGRTSWFGAGAAPLPFHGHLSHGHQGCSAGGCRQWA